MSNEKLIRYINYHKWWRTGIPDEKAIKARGLFYASSYKDAEFYGRPIDTPFSVNVKNPLFGDETHIMQLLGLPLLSPVGSIKERFALDAKMMRHAIAKNYDAIALFTTNGYEKYLKNGTTPRSIELQVFQV